MSHSLLRILLLVLGLAVVAGGCQRRPTFTFAPVEGTATKNGRPLADVQVVFYGDSDAGTRGPRASGITDKDGHYRLQGDVIRGEPAHSEGAVVGKHRVCIVDLQATLHTPVDKRRVPSRYGSINETPLRVEVQRGPQVIDFEVKANGVEVK